MAKQQRRTAKVAATRKKAVAPVKAKVKRTAPSSATARSKPVAKPSPKPVAKAVAAPEPAPPPPPRKPGFYEAVAIYERGVQALQRHDYQAAADQFRVILDKYPEERELLERARLYLRVCERETARQPPDPKTAPERVYAATVALNSGDHAGAMSHLQRALTEDPDSDHAHYTMAVALGMRGRIDEGLEHLRNAIGLNPDNRNLAKQDPDLEALRDHASFRSVLDTPASNRRRLRPRR